MKYRIFQLKANIRAIENDIRALERQKEVLNIELTYLTNPERLRKLYVEVKKLDVRTFEGKELVSIDQIKNIKTLIPYYYSKLEKYNGKNSVALK
ncbi:MAG: hypothetical protein LBS34_02970 [Rickettsiales bacterium]|nr:hypothetical protein [Rickettsiales bacterium]